MQTSSKMAVLALSLLAAKPIAYAAPTLTTLTSFPAGTSGSYSSLIADANGDLYGTTVAGGASQTGSVFRLVPPSRGQANWSEETIWNFSGSADGSYPYAGVVLNPASGALYGVTTHGGSFGWGTVFELSPPAPGQSNWTETTIWNFPAGYYSGTSGVIRNSATGALFGTTEGGGNFNKGTVFILTPPAHGSTQWTSEILWSFGGAGDGSTPSSGVVADRSGALYGTTIHGGGGSCPDGYGNVVACGVVFKLTPPARGQTNWIEAVLYAFNGLEDGFEPSADLTIDAVGAIYGTTADGGSGSCLYSYNNVNYNLGCGTVFKLAPPSPGTTLWSHSILWSFTNYPNDGATPYSSLIADNAGSLYGTTFGGGSYAGTVFKLTPPVSGQTQWSESILSDLAPPNGDFANAGLAERRGILYGTTASGGSAGGGTVFEETGVGWNSYPPGAISGPPVLATSPVCVATHVQPGTPTHVPVVSFANNCGYDVSFYACIVENVQGQFPCSDAYELYNLAAQTTFTEELGISVPVRIVTNVKECPENYTFPLGLITSYICVRP